MSVEMDLEFREALGRSRVRQVPARRDEQVVVVTPQVQPSFGTLVPRQEPGVLRRLMRRALRIFRPVQQLAPEPEIPMEDPPETVGLGVEPRTFQSQRAVVDRQTAERNRLKAYRDFEDMDLMTPEVSRALDIISESATSNDRGDPTFRLVFSEDVPPEAQAIAEAMVERLKLKQNSAEMCRSTVKYGDLFAELVVDDDGTITQLMPRYVATIIRIQDKHGNLAGFVQKIPGHTNVVAEFAPGQMLHVRHGKEWGARYGRSMCRPGRFLWRHLQGMTDGVVHGRLTRGVQRYGYLVPVNERLTWQDRIEYIERFKEKNRREPLVDEDGHADLRTLAWADAQNVYLPVDKSGVGDIRVLEASRSIGTIDDARWLHRRFLVTLPPPPSYLGIEEDVNSKATLQFEEKNFTRYLKAKQQREMGPAMTRLVRIQWALKDIFLPLDAVEVRYAPSSILDEKLRAEINKINAETAEILGNQLGLPMDWIIKHMLGLTTEAAQELTRALAQNAPTTQQMPPPEGEEELRSQAALRKALAMHDNLQGLVETLLDVLADLQEQNAPPRPYEGD